jgi:predicted HAD superfamily Cof-like phosphohydrolase
MADGRVNAGIERIREHLIANGIPAKDFTEERVAAAAVTMARGVRAAERSEASRMAEEFHTHPNARNDLSLFVDVLKEEHEELLEAIDLRDRAKIARECADVLYMVYGIAWLHEFDLDAALREIHRAAMDKMRAGLRRADGKIVKPPGFVAPDMTEACGG